MRKPALWQNAYALNKCIYKLRQEIETSKNAPKTITDARLFVITHFAQRLGYLVGSGREVSTKVYLEICGQKMSPEGA